MDKAIKIHDTYPVVTAAFGRSMTGGLLMGSMLKEEERLSLQINGSGEIGKIIVNVDAKGNINGYIINPYVELKLKDGKLDVGKDGTLKVIKDLNLKEPWIGEVPLQTGEIAEDLTYYFAVSEQILTAVSLGVLVEEDGSVKASGGFIIQLLPNASETLISKVENLIKKYTTNFFFNF